MKTTPFREVIILALIGCMGLVASKGLLPNINLNALKTVSSVTSPPVEEIQSTTWYMSHREEANNRIQACRKDSRLTFTQNCINAEYALKIVGR